MKFFKPKYEEAEAVDFSSATRKALFGKEAERVIPGEGRSAAELPERHLRVKVTMNFDGDVLSFFKRKARDEGRSYQVLINDVLREFVEGTRPEQMAQEVGQILLRDSSFLELLHRTLLEKAGNDR